MISTPATPRTWIYKCNARNSAGPATGDWRHLFDEGHEVWGDETLKGMDLVRKGDRVIATQTDRNELVGVAEIVGFVRIDDLRHAKLRPRESIRVKIRPLKKANRAIASIPALQGGRIATIYEISERDAGRLLAAARRAKPARATEGVPPVTPKPGKVSPDSVGSYLRESQGFEPDPKVRRAIEMAAVGKARRHYTGKGYTVEELGKPYDLECTKGRATLLVEVKGSRGPATKILLTPNEVEVARKRKMELFVVHSMTVAKAGRRVVAKGGKVQLVSPWRPDLRRLKPVVYVYEPKSGEGTTGNRRGE